MSKLPTICTHGKHSTPATCSQCAGVVAVRLPVPIGRRIDECWRRPRGASDVEVANAVRMVSAELEPRRPVGKPPKLVSYRGEIITATQLALRLGLTVGTVLAKLSGKRPPIPGAVIVERSKP